MVQDLHRRVRGEQEAEAWVHGGVGSGRGPLEAALFQECGHTWPRQVEEASSAHQLSHGAARWHGARPSVSARRLKVLPCVYGNPCQRRQHRSHNFFIFKPVDATRLESILYFQLRGERSRRLCWVKLELLMTTEMNQCVPEQNQFRFLRLPWWSCHICAPLLQPLMLETLGYSSWYAVGLSPRVQKLDWVRKERACGL